MDSEIFPKIATELYVFLLGKGPLAKVFARIACFSCSEKPLARGSAGRHRRHVINSYKCGCSFISRA